MKKLLLIVVALFAANAAFGQLGLLGIGIKAGVNVSSLSNSDWGVTDSQIDGMDGKSKTSYYVGLYREFRIFNFAIQPEVVYSRQGNRYKEGGYEINNRVNYLNIPIMLKYYFFKGLSVDVGPQFGILMNGKRELDGFGSGNDGNHSTTDEYKSNDFSLAMGLSCKLLGKLDITARYNLGFTKILEDGGDSKNRVFQFGVGVRF